jgi:membrane-bound lytic murein transglycosylase D
MVARYPSAWKLLSVALVLALSWACQTAQSTRDTSSPLTSPEPEIHDPVPQEAPAEVAAQEPADLPQLDDGDPAADAGAMESEGEPEGMDSPALAAPPVDPAEVRQQALEACDAADALLDEGNLDGAIAALDHAYELMLSLDGSDDPVILSDKDDLRLLIAERLVNLYASQRTAAAGPKINWDLEIQLVSNDLVKKEIALFQGPERSFFIESYRRSGLYRPMILAKLEEAGLPSQLSWLPLIESGFKVQALSRASALGLWQFIRSTGNRYGLKHDAYVDERMDPVKATDAAISYLSDLHDIFGDWPEALAGYNCGAYRVLRLNNRSSDQDLDFWDFYQLLPQETRRYIPRYFATLLILEDPAAYGIELPEPLPPLPETAVVTTSRNHKLEDIDKELGLAKGTIASLNPELRNKVTPDRSYDLQIPLVQHSTMLARLDKLPVWRPPQPTYTSYRVRSGDTLSTIARRHGTSVTAITRANGIRNRHRISIGQVLKVPLGYSSSRSSSREPAIPPVVSDDGRTITHTIRRGDTLYEIAKTYGTTVGKIKADNKLTSNTLMPGQKLTIHPGSRHGSRSYVVKSGDTPSAIARAHGVSLSALMRLNGLTSRTKIYPGQSLLIPNS